MKLFFHTKNKTRIPKSYKLYVYIYIYRLGKTITTKNTFYEKSKHKKKSGFEIFLFHLKKTKKKS
jgi:hypothetical protein